jgi:hypothetical protein
MQVVYTRSTFANRSARLSHQVKAWVKRAAPSLVIGLAIIGTLHLAGMNLLSQSTASVEPPIANTPIQHPYGYFPDQFVNQATVIEPPIEQF